MSGSSNNLTNNYTILFVDDEYEVNISAVNLLQHEGYKVITSDNGRDAIEIMKNNNIDILILDYFMKGFDGDEVVKEIRKFNKEVFILLQTGYSGQKPPLDTMKSLNIQGYHDKNDGPEKFLLWVYAGVNVCAQMRQNMQLCRENELAEKTLESIKKDRALLIEHTTNELDNVPKKIIERFGSIIRDVTVPIKSSIEKLDSIIKMIDNNVDRVLVINMLKEVCKNTNDVKETLRRGCEDLNVECDQKKKVTSITTDIFSLDEFFQKLQKIVNKDVLLKFDTVLNRKHNIIRDMKEINLEGDPVYLLKAVYKIIVKSALLSQKPKAEEFSEIDFEINEKPHFLEFRISYFGVSTIEKLLNEECLIIDNNVESTNTIIDIVTVFLNGEIYFEEKGGKTTTIIVLPCKN